MRSTHIRNDFVWEVIFLPYLIKNDTRMERNDTTKITIEESNLLVTPGKSKRLEALRQQSRFQEPEHTEMQKAAIPVALSKDAALALSEARAHIRRQIEQIKKRYPSGRQNKLFAIRYGDLERLKHKTLKEIFALLELDANRKNFNLIGHLDFDGNEIGGGKTGATEKTWKKRP